MPTSPRAARGVLFFAGAAWLGVRVWGASPAAPAVTTVLESSALRVEVTAEPYSYAVIEKATGEVLLRHAQTTFTVGTGRSAGTAVIGAKRAATLDASLTFPGSSDTAHVRWTFVRQGRGNRPARGHPEVEQQLDAGLGAVAAHRVLSGGRSVQIRR